jgi:hypothetical protein
MIWIFPIICSFKTGDRPPAGEYLFAFWWVPPVARRVIFASAVLAFWLELQCDVLRRLRRLAFWFGTSNHIALKWVSSCGSGFSQPLSSDCHLVVIYCPLCETYPTNSRTDLSPTYRRGCCLQVSGASFSDTQSERHPQATHYGDPSCC